MQLLNCANQSLASSRTNLLYTGIRIAVVVIAVAVFLLVGVNYKRILHRFRNGLCLHCGYDLRGIADRCPECGTDFGRLPHIQ